MVERNGGETALEFDWFRLGCSLFRTFLNNLDELLLDVLKGHLHHKGMHVNFLHLEEVEHIGEAAEAAELRVMSIRVK